MRGDFSRQTFIQEKHYSGVLMQQGRVQVDADWNELQAIQQHRVETEAGDVIGPCGAPEDASGFRISVKDNSLVIGPGRYYVDGILCENEDEVGYQDQTDLPDPASVVAALTAVSRNVGLVFLDVWQRHITTLEDGHIREKALGGPDTATRAKTVWQVRVQPLEVPITNPAVLTTLLHQQDDLNSKLSQARNDPAQRSAILGKLAKIAQEIDTLLGGVNCAGHFSEWEAQISPSTGTLNARTQPEIPPKDPCVIPAGAGYRRLENQLYRVEIHEAGSLNVPGQTKKATFKWSRENGSIVTAWQGQSGPNNEYLAVASSGRDGVLGFAAGQWVELTDDKHELDGAPGTLVRLVNVEGQTLTIDPATVIPAGASILRGEFGHTPKVRRWDSPEGAATVAVPAANDGWLTIEDGIEVKFSNGTYHTGDYWLIPARTDGGEIEWPPYHTPNPTPLRQPPLGIQHQYCRLALLYLDEAGKLHVLSDCRRLFPPLTRLIDLYYAGGDGQEAMPDPTQPQNLVALAEPLQVGVANWRWPVDGATVLFQVTQGHGQLQGLGSQVTLQTGLDGIASCSWRLDSTTQDQQVQATLLDHDGQPMQVPIRFHANLSVASQVAYNPAGCDDLSGVQNVQDALDRLCRRQTGGGCSVTVGKNGQYVKLDQAMLELLKQDRLDICICLLPGDHDLESLVIAGNDRPVHVSIGGCGTGTRIHARGLWKLSQLASFTLRDVQVQAPDVQQFMLFEKCDEVTLDGCHVRQTGVNEGGFLCGVVRAGRVRLSDTVLEAYASTSLTSPVKLLTGLNEDAAKLFAVQDPETFRSQAAEGAQKLTGLSLQARRALVKGLQAALKKADALAGPERTAYDSFAKTMTTPVVEADILAGALQTLRDAADVAVVPTALVIFDANADTTLRNNEIRGLVSLYGLPGGAGLTPDELKIETLKKIKEQGGFKLSRPGASLRLTDSRLTRLTIGAGMLKAIREALGSGQAGTLESVFRSGHFTNNVLTDMENLFVAQQLALTSNWFAVGDVPGQAAPTAPAPTAALCIAGAATYTGNQGLDGDIASSTLYNLARFSGEAANLLRVVG